MHTSLDQALGRNPRLNRVGQSLLNIASGASAAYSLRSLTGGDPNVVRVRRDSDNAERDFTASEVSSGELERWVNIQNTLPLDLRTLQADGRTGAIIDAKAAYSLRDLTSNRQDVRTTTSFVLSGATNSFAIYNGTRFIVGEQTGALAFFDESDSNIFFRYNASASAWKFQDLSVQAGSLATAADDQTYPWQSDWTGSDFASAVFTREEAGKYTVEVRRNIDGSTKSFTAAEVSDGTLTTWVNESFNDALPLDTSSGASAAYSLRNLSSSYSGNVVEVRRSSDDTERNFTASEVSDGTLTDWVTDAASSILNSAYYFAGDVHSHVTLDSDITLQDGESMSLKYFWGGTTSGVEVLLDFNGPTTNAILIKTNGELRVRINAESIDVGTTLVSNAIDTLTISRSGNTVTFTTGSGSTAVEFTSGALRFQELGGTSGQTMNGVFYDWNIGSRHSYTGLGATAWEDTIGSNDGTPSNLVSFTGQELNGFVKTWYDQSGNSNNATQTTPGNQPKIVDGGSLNKDSNNNISVKFDSSEEHHLNNTTLPSSFTSSNATFSDFTVQESFQNNATGFVFGFGSTSSTNVRLNKLVHSGGNYGYQGFGSTAAFQSAFDTVSYSANDVFLGSGLRVGTDLDIFKNSADADMNNTFDTGTLAVNTFAIGAYVRSTGISSPFNGNITELIIYDSDQSTKRRAIEENIANHYGITLSSFSRDGFVKTWYDQSSTTGTANNNHATQSDSSKQPKIVEGGNYLGEIDFDGSNHYFDLTSAIGATTESAVFAVAESGGGTDNFIIDNRDAGGDGFRLFRGSSQLKFNWQAVTIANGTLSTDTKFIGFGNHSSSVLSVGVNGASTTSSDSNSVSVTAVPRIGARSFTSPSGYWDGTMNEIIIYDTDQTDNRTALEANIGEHYSISGIPAYDNTVNGFVETWYDQSGSGNNATQTSADAQPKIVNSGTKLDHLLFDGSNDFLSSPGFAFSPSGDMLISSVQKQTTGQVYDTRDGANDGIFVQQGGTSLKFRYNGDGSVDESGNDDLSLATFEIDGTTMTVYKNGSSVGTDTVVAGLSTTADLNIGKVPFSNANYANGQIHEIVMYASDQSANRAALEANIAAANGITLS